MNRKQILEEVEGIICRDRNTQHGEPEDVFATIADFWTTYMSSRVGVLRIQIEPHDVAAMMVLFKLARHAANPSNPDNPIDATGYSAIVGELSPETNT